MWGTNISKYNGKQNGKQIFICYGGFDYHNQTGNKMEKSKMKNRNKLCEIHFFIRSIYIQSSRIFEQFKKL